MSFTLRPWALSLCLAAAGLACSLSPAAPTTAPAEPTPVDSAVVEATVEATEPAAPTQAPTVAAFSGATACDHAYLPLKVGAVWEYDGISRLVQTVTAVDGDSAQATATLSSKAGDSAADTLTYVCTPEGIRRGDTVYSDMTTYKNTFVEGFEVPAAELLSPGYVWSYTLEEDVDGLVTVLTRESEVVAARTVELDGQTYDALDIAFTQSSVDKASGQDMGKGSGEQTWVLGVGVYGYGEAYALKRFTPGEP